MNKTTLDEIIKSHELWLVGNKHGRRANLESANLEDSDLSGKNLEKANLQNVNLNRSNLANTNLNGAYLAKASLALANLENSTLVRADLESSILQGANFNESNLRECNLQNSNLSGTNFFQADISKSNLKGANLEFTNFLSANLDQCLISSKASIGNLGNQLYPDQLQQIIFLDEINSENKKKVKDSSNERMIITISGTEISPYNTSILLATINSAYNNLFFLINYAGHSQEHNEEFIENEDEESIQIKELRSIREKMTPFYQGVGIEDDIFITSVRSGSQIYEIATATLENYPILQYLAAILAFSGGSYTWFSIERKRYNETKKIKAEVKKLELETESISLDNMTKELIIQDKESNQQIKAHLDTVQNHPDMEKLLEKIPFNSEIVKENSTDLVSTACQPLLVVHKKLTAYNYDVKIELSNNELLQDEQEP